MARAVSARVGKQSSETTPSLAEGQGSSQPSKRPFTGINVRYASDAALPPGGDVAEAVGVGPAPRVVEVRDLAAERAGRVFPCLTNSHTYTGCIGFERCQVLCWSPRQRERQVLMRVAKPVSAPCRTCEYAREVPDEVALLNGREVRLIECRLGFWHGYTTVGDFARSKIPLNVTLPCPGYAATEAAHPAIERARRAARLRKK